MRNEEALEGLSDRDLDAALLGLVAAERECVADILLHLAEVDARGMYVAEGYASLFAYATEHLGMTRAAAGHRITAARLLVRFPVIHSMVASGAIHVAGLKLLSPYLTVANHEELLLAATGKSKRAIEELVAARYPKSDVLPLVVARRVSASGAEAEAGTESGAGAGTGTVAESGTESGTESESESEVEVEVEEAKDVREARPLSADSYAITFTIDRACKDKLAEAQALLSHRLPSGDPGAIMSLALEVLLAKVRKERFAVTDAPRAGRPRKSGTRYIPAEDKREVWQRDGERCAFVSAGGKRCTETRFLETHHVEPHGKGGPPTAGNLQMLCRVHNNHYAEADFGKAHMARAKSSPRVPADLLKGRQCRAPSARIQCAHGSPGGDCRGLSGRGNHLSPRPDPRGPAPHRRRARRARTHRRLPNKPRGLFTIVDGFANAPRGLFTIVDGFANAPRGLFMIVDGFANAPRGLFTIVDSFANKPRRLFPIAAPRRAGVKATTKARRRHNRSDRPRPLQRGAGSGGPPQHHPVPSPQPRPHPQTPPGP